MGIGSIQSWKLLSQARNSCIKDAGHIRKELKPMREPKQNSKGAKRWFISRRTFLRGVGVTMSLPWLESLPSWGEEVTPAAGDAAAAFPKRFAVLFWGNGVNPNHWWAKGAGREMELGKCLEPLAPLKTKLNVISGLFNRAAVGVGIHPGQTGNCFRRAAAEGRGAARAASAWTRCSPITSARRRVQPSIVLGCEQPITGYHETNFSMAYSSHISWQNADSPVPMEVYPSLAFDSLFENRGSRRNKSILDRVKDEAASLQPPSQLEPIRPSSTNT